LAVCQYYLIQIAFSTTTDTFLQELQFGISINLEAVVFLGYIVFLPINAVHYSVMGAKIRALPSLPNMEDQKL
jgi:hypothetical protein